MGKEAPLAASASCSSKPFRSSIARFSTTHPCIAGLHSCRNFRGESYVMTLNFAVCRMREIAFSTDASSSTRNTTGSRWFMLWPPPSHAEV